MGSNGTNGTKNNGNYIYKQLPSDSDSVKYEIDEHTTTGNNNGGLHSLSQYSSSHFLRISYRRFIQIVGSAPLLAFIFCVIWALSSDFYLATNTLCNGHYVANFLPSFSSATGNFEVAKGVWRFVIGLQSVIGEKYVIWIYLAALLNSFENIGLLGLTYFSSLENFGCFYLFVVSSELYMFILCSLLSWGKKKGFASNTYELKGLRFKWRLFGTMLICSVLLYIIYKRHIYKCEQGVYSLFAVVEYILVLSNIGFHVTSYYDFFHRVLIV